MDRPFTPEQLAKLRAKRRRKWEERRRRAIEAWLRWQEEIHRRIEEARRRRQKFLFWLLVGLILTQALSNLFVLRPTIYLPKPKPQPPRRKPQVKNPLAKKRQEWQPSPYNDFRPQDGHDDYIDGYSRDAWEKYADEKGWRSGSKSALRTAWELDPERQLFPSRYRDGYDHRPSLFELTGDFCDPHQRDVAFQALLIAAPAEARTWLQEVYVSDPGQIRRAFAKTSPEIVENFKSSAIRWEDQKNKEADEACNAARKLKRDKGHNTDIEENEDDEHGIP